MNNLGRNKTLWLKRQGCVFIEQPHQEWEKEGCNSTTVETKYGEYITLADLPERHQYEVNFIYRHRLTELSSVNRGRGKPLSKYGCNTVSIGFNEKEQAWYGWTHRGYGKFYIGYEVVKGSIVDFGKHKFPFKVKTLEEAKMLACDIADFLN